MLSKRAQPPTVYLEVSPAGAQQVILPNSSSSAYEDGVGRR